MVEKANKKKGDSLKRILAGALLCTTVVSTVPMGQLQAEAASVEPTVSAGGDHTMFLKTDGSVWATGRNNNGQLGDGTNVDKYTPVKIAEDVINMESGLYFTVFLKEDGTAWTTSGDLVLEKGSVENIKSISAGHYHRIFLREDGTVYAVGENVYGQLGDGTNVSKSTPVKMKIDNVKQVKASIRGSFLLKEDNSLWATGLNDIGQLGDGTTAYKSTPVKIMDNVEDFYVGGHFVVFKEINGDFFAFGDNRWGVFGSTNKTYYNKPIRLPYSITEVLSTGYGSLIYRNSEGIWAIGRNDYGQLGDGTNVSKSTPVKIDIAGNIVKGSMGKDYHRFLFDSAGTVWATGLNDYGQLGDGTTTNKSTPVQINTNLGTYSPDETAPTLTLSPSTTAWTNQAVKITARAEDEADGSGVKNITLPDNTVIAGDVATFEASSNQSYTFKAEDQAGNIIEGVITIANIDKVAPEATLTAPTAPTNKNVVIEVKATDDASGVKGINLPDGRTVLEAETAYTAERNGTYSFTIIDNAGNETAKSVEINNIDRTLPVITTSDLSTEWTNQNVVVTAEADKGTLNADSHTFTSNSTFTFIATDEAGNEATKAVSVANIDKIAPTKPALQVVNDVLKLTASTDSLSGIKEHQYSINDSEWSTWAGDIDLLAMNSSTYIVKVKAIDNAGNESETATITIKVDNKLLENATLAVEKAEALVTQNSINHAQEAINKLPESQDKTNLQNRLDQVQDQLNAKNDINQATKSEDLDKIQEDIDAMPEGSVKDELQNQLESKKEELNKLKEATEAVEQAEELRTKENIDSARELVNELNPSKDKTALNNRLNIVEKEIAAYAKLEKDAIKAVEYAELLKTDALVSGAYDKVNQLKDGELKNELLARLDALLGAESVNGKISYKTALRFVQMAEALKRDPHISRAVMFAGRVADEVERAELLARANNVKPTVVDKKALKDAKTAMDAAEKRPSNVSLKLAETRINLLEDSAEKDELLARLNTLKNN